MNDRFLIPANSKQSSYMFGLFNKLDLIVILTGLITTFTLLYTVDLNGILAAILAILPGGLAAILVMPLPNYHNTLTILLNAYKFFTTRQNFVWKGWCFYDIKDDSEQNSKKKFQIH